MRSFIGWVGGKSRLAKTIVKKIPDHRVYVEVFGGAGWVLFEKPPETSKVEVYNDLNGDLVNLFRVVKNRPAAFQEKIRNLLYSRRTYYEFWNQVKAGLDDEVDRAVKFYYCVRSGFGAKPGGSWGIGRKSKPREICRPDKINLIAERLKAVYIEATDFSKLIPAWDSPDTLFYLDPPYVLEEKFYAFDFKESDHLELREVIENIKGKMVLSYNDTRQVRKLYKGFKISSTKQVHYYMNNKRQVARKKAELVIKNF